MVSSVLKRCCNLGCNKEKINNEGYKVGFGFMLWACPDHESIWMEFDKKLCKYRIDKGKAYDAALENFEDTWDDNYAKDNPEPKPPFFQPSVI